jgi:ADP-heptose:LPS heptosyltransferase
MAFPDGQPQKKQAFLIVSLDNLGDLVFASALVAPLREHFPEARIGLWCKSYSAGLAPLISDIDDVYAADPFWDRSPGTGKGSLSAFLSAIRGVRRARFDCAILSSAPWRTSAAVAAARVPQRIGLERRRNGRWLTDVLPPEDRKKPVLEEIARLLVPLEIQRSGLRYRLDASRLDNEHSVVTKVIGSDSFVALHPFAGSEARCVALDEWVRVADELAGRDEKVLWIGNGSELSRLRAFKPNSESWRYSDSLSNGDLTTVAAAISRARILVGHDSGPMHIAAALRVPTIGVFAPGEPARTFPQGEGEWRIVSRQSPRDITADQILEEAKALLQ